MQPITKKSELLLLTLVAQLGGQFCILAKIRLTNRQGNFKC